MRTINLSNSLIKRGHKVIIWASNFDHYSKKHRFKKGKSVKYSNQIEIKLLNSVGYKSHISLSRVIDHIGLAFSLKKYLKNEVPPDVAFIGFPPIETAWIMTSWLRKKNIPIMLDVKDAWPEIFTRTLPSKFTNIFMVFLFPYFNMRNITFRISNAISAPTKEFLNWSIIRAKRNQNDYDCVAPLTVPDVLYSRNEILTAEKWLDTKKIYNNDTIKLTFIGSLTNVFDFNPIIEVASKLPIQFIFAGDGPNYNRIHNETKKYSNVIMVGRVNSVQAKVLTLRSSAMLAPLKDLEDFKMSIPNKFFDAMCNNKAIITSVSGVSEELIKHYKIGFKYSNYDNSLLNILEYLSTNVYLFEEYGLNARRLYESKFTYESVYENLTDKLEKLAKNV